MKEFFIFLKIFFYKLIGKETVAQKAYKLLKTVPEQEWMTGLTNKVDKCCMLGHYQRLITNPKDYRLELLVKGYSSDLQARGDEFLRTVHGINGGITLVNDTKKVNGYTEPEIKDRCMHLLKDMIAAGY